MRRHARPRPAVEALEHRVHLSGGGQFDPSFADGGQALVNLNPLVGVTTTMIYVGDTALQLDGKIVIAGTVLSREMEKVMFVLRLSPDGRLDRSFAENGIRLLPFAGAITKSCG